MPSTDLETQSCSIVLIGDFNPKIFQPAWFASEGLVSGSVAENAKIQVIHPELTVLEFEDYRMQIEASKFLVATSSDPLFEVIRDLTLSTFELLRHTPVRMMGINTEMHYRIDTEANWHAFGDKLVPKATWKTLLDSPGMRSVTVEEGKRRDGNPGKLLVKVEPSQRMKHGVYFHINDHFELDATSKVVGATQMMEVLRSSWTECQRRAKEIVDALLKDLH